MPFVALLKKYNLPVKVEKLKQPRGFELKKDVFSVNGTFSEKTDSVLSRGYHKCTIFQQQNVWRTKKLYNSNNLLCTTIKSFSRLINHHSIPELNTFLRGKC